MTIALDRISEHHFISSWLDQSAASGEIIVVDLGMNEGEFSSKLSRRYPSAKIYGAEANPTLAAKVRSDLGFDCRNYAITGANGPVTFGVDSMQSMSSAIGAQGAGLQQVTVEGIRFADFLDRIDLTERQVDLLKVDIEGSELDLFSGTPERVLTRIRQICVEFHAFKHRDHIPKINQIISNMEKIGFFCVDFTTNYQDVLMVNNNGHSYRLTPFEKLSISTQKYVRGAKRKIAKFF